MIDESIGDLLSSAIAFHHHVAQPVFAEEAVATPRFGDTVGVQHQHVAGAQRRRFDDEGRVREDSQQRAVLPELGQLVMLTPTQQCGRMAGQRNRD